MVITAVSGSSEYFIGGMLAYSNDVKVQKLGVPEEVIRTHGAVSEQCAAAMAAGGRNVFGSTYALSVTGVAGPTGGSDEKPVGTVYIGLAAPDAVYAKRFSYGRDREINRTRAVYSALDLLRRQILGIS